MNTHIYTRIFFATAPGEDCGTVAESRSSEQILQGVGDTIARYAVLRDVQARLDEMVAAVEKECDELRELITTGMSDVLSEIEREAFGLRLDRETDKVVEDDVRAMEDIFGPPPSKPSFLSQTSPEIQELLKRYGFIP
jgi:hypothetical protein